MEGFQILDFAEEQFSDFLVVDQLDQILKEFFLSCFVGKEGVGEEDDVAA